MKKKLILHIGTPKTGTTSIQNALAGSIKNLESMNIYYPKVKSYNHSVNFYPMFLNKPEENIKFIQRGLSKGEILSEINDYKELWRAELSKRDNGTYIISSEFLSYMSYEEILALKDFILPYFEEVKIIMYARHFSTLIPSMIQQVSKSGSVPLNLEGLLAYYLDKDSPSMYTSCLQHWVSLFGNENVIVRAFDKKSFVKANLITDFFAAIELEHIDTSKFVQPIRNESIGKNSAILLSSFNQKYPRLVNGSLNKERGLVEYVTPTSIFHGLKEEKFKFELKLNERQVNILNQEIDFINKFLEEKDQFDYFKINQEGMQMPNFNEISFEYYLDLLNGVYKELEKSVKGNEFYQKLFDLSEENKKIFIWGTGASGLSILELVKKLDLEIMGFIDSDQNKKGKILEGYSIDIPSELEKYRKEEVFILVGSMYYSEIETVLNRMGFNKNKHYLVKYALI